MKTKRQWHTTLNHSLLAGVLICGANVAWAGDFSSFFSEKKTPANVEEDSVPTTITRAAKEDSLPFPTTKEGIVNALTKPTTPDRNRSLGGSRKKTDAPPKAGANILFDFGSAVIRPESYDWLRQYGEIFTEDMPYIIVGIEGHTDSVGSAWRNWELSKKRAQAVKVHLVRHYGIDPERLIVTPKGETEPMGEYSNRTREGRAKNRRVVFVNLSKLD